MLVAPSSNTASSSSSPTLSIDAHSIPSNGVSAPSTSRTPSGYRRSYLQFSDLRTKRRRTLGTLTSTLREEGNMRLENHPSDHQQLPLHSALCSDCVPVCRDEVCAVPKLALPVVEECTEGCVVVPCDKETLCFDDICLGETCDMKACDGGEDCMAYEDFLQCCTDDHAYFGAQKDQASSNLSWDVAFDTFFRNNRLGSPHIPSPPSSADSYQTLSSSSISEDYGWNHYPNIPGSGMQTSPCRQHDYYQSSQQAYSNPSSQQGAPSISGEQFTCRWSGCSASFQSMNELVGHVNLSHLRPPSSSISLRPPLNGQNQVQCQWDDCNMFPSSTMFTGPSIGLDPDALYGMLESHVMREHLPPQTYDVGFNLVSNPPFAAPQRQQQGFPNLPDGDVPFQLQPQPPHQYTMQDNHSQHLHSQVHMYSLPYDSARGTVPIPQSSDKPSSPEPDTEADGEAAGPTHDCAKVAHVCAWVGCGARSFPSCDALTAHISADHVGSGKSQYHCHWEGCTRHGEHGFSSKQKILRHLQSHTGHRPFQCQICQQNFSEAATLQQHMRRHTQEKPFVCDFPGCGKAFAITGALTIHKRTHNGERPFKCPHCDKAFSESSNLSKHMKTHTGDRPYKCPEPGCDKCFARPDQLTRHTNVHTKKRVSGLVS